jgi:hypothetical protein
MADKKSIKWSDRTWKRFKPEFKKACELAKDGKLSGKNHIYTVVNEAQDACEFFSDSIRRTPESILKGSPDFIKYCIRNSLPTTQTEYEMYASGRLGESLFDAKNKPKVEGTVPAVKRSAYDKPIGTSKLAVKGKSVVYTKDEYQMLAEAFVYRKMLDPFTRSDEAILAEATKSCGLIPRDPYDVLTHMKAKGYLADVSNEMRPYIVHLLKSKFSFQESNVCIAF